MKFVQQNLQEILDALGPLNVEWQDETARRVIASIEEFPIKETYDRQDLSDLLHKNFRDGLVIFRLLLCMSKDAFLAELSGKLASGKSGVTAFRKDPEAYLDALSALGVLDAMALEVNRQPSWSDRIVDRLRTMRGRAISGQRRGRGLEDATELIVRQVFEHRYEKRCSFTGIRNREAKSDFAIPDRHAPRILIEVKAYGATGSKMTDIIGDIDAIRDAKRPDTSFLFITDGVTWQSRKSDLQKIIDRQNNGEITRIYTTSMFSHLEEDLQTLKQEYSL